MVIKALDVSFAFAAAFSVPAIRLVLPSLFYILFDKKCLIPLSMRAFIITMFDAEDGIFIIL